MSEISAVEADWSREEFPAWSWHPSRALLKSIRDYQRWKAKRGVLSGFFRRMALLRHRFWSVVTGADIPVNCHLGGGLLMPHPNGIVIHPDAQIGPNCLIFQQVTIGAEHGGVPCIGGHVDIGAGAKLIGRVRVGDHSKIGANAVVVQDVPAGAVAVGIPARVIRRPGDPSKGGRRPLPARARTPEEETAPQ